MPVFLHFVNWRFLVSVLVMAIPAAVRAQTLFFLDQSKPGECAGKTIELPSKAEKVLFSAKSCPGVIVWEAGGINIMYVEGETLWSRPAQGGRDAPRELAKLPRPDVELWIEQSSGKPRIAYMVPVADEDAGGGSFKLGGRVYDARELPEFGTPAVAFVDQLEDGEWKRIEARATKSEAGETPGLGVLDAYRERKSAGASLADLLRRATCVGGGPLDCSPEPADPETKALVASADGAYGVAKAAGGGLFAFGVIYGDTPHATSPVYFCKSSCKSAIRLKEVSEPQLSIAVEGGYALVSTEYDSANARIYDARTGTLVLSLPKSASSAWLPGNRGEP